jgi:ferric-dicitrate binding protein FerR (iron transport regulator)
MSIDVNIAWDKLHTRLADDQLLDPGAKTVAMPFITKMKWAAAIVVLCICGGAAGLFLFPTKDAAQLFTLHNNEAANTLVSTLRDGSIVYLTDGATLTCPEHFATNKRQVALQGEALFDVHSDRDCPFLIETESAVVEVLGTAFNIKSGGSKLFELSVQRGLVRITLKATGVQTLVEAGETVRLEANHQLQKEQSTGQQQFIQYTEKMRFKDEPLDNIVNVINRISGKPIVFADNLLAGQEKMTITFDNNTPSDMVELLCVAMNLTHTDNGDSIVIAPSTP